MALAAISRERWAAVKAVIIRYMDLTMGSTLFTFMLKVSGSEPKGEIR